MERELEMLKWMTDKLSKISSYRTKKNVSRNSEKGVGSEEALL